MDANITVRFIKQVQQLSVFFLLLLPSTLFYGDEGVVFNARGNLNFNAFFSEGAFWGTGVHFAINTVYLVGNLILEKILKPSANPENQTF